MTNVENLANVLKVLASESRLSIIQNLRKRSLCVTELTGRLGISQEATSQHLRALKDAAILKSQKRGLYVYYYLHVANMERLYKMVSRLFKLDPKRKIM